MTRRASKPRVEDVAQLFTAPPAAAPTPPVIDVVIADTPALPLAMREVLSLPARLISELPRPTTLLLSDGTLITTSKPVYESARRVRDVVFMGIELRALALAADHERASPAVWQMWRARKVDDSAWKLTAAHALGGAGSPEPKGTTLARVLRCYGLELFDVSTDNELPQARPNA